ncbi:MULTISPECIES: DUF2252 domain-containing protein [unclassified Microcystis]|jgi:uncharacterized protein (DUF2252 family)|uniref:DUF2252 domain-containing protein n=1 Tax=Microcystis flos-aquae Mf_QC_C_20070823_S10D TaxID=2486236 RepID=A0A552KK63_9CHRO|nr:MULTISPECIES: DUF2252 domain-containing protein [unclassified Microcystis]MCA2815598.1 DUF2252 domain-containing protein [Microcystis sp. M085S1]MCA2855525.1 DUF2252 domain-containing protein [Microcystis sp. M065S1]TRT81619.1 MAG: DUF2252 domain-containing protein [Microcystis flos-aquae Ma_QC_C_20070823_S18]TRU03442.1 MAG: DUF2252 domain-containing protein [Microcystis flos-aquae Ma_QC_C_20070823_S18D]TRV08376.1 MAG: DUF2252 domain-containing protein [Microcystis flos-aquae Mf_QC_C_200708
MNHQIETPIRSPSQARFRSREERIQIGKSLRERLPRSRHAIWQPPAAGREPIEIIEASNRGRLQELIPIRYGRMLRSPFTFLRGSAALMAYDLATTPKTDIIVQACGDCHLLNFGFFATPERNLVFDINDFDETLPAPWEWDLKRLVVSFVIAGRDSDLSDRESKAAAIDCARSYREHLREYSRLSPLEVWYTRIGVEQVLEMAPDEKTRKIREQMMTKARERIIEHLYPKIVTQSGGRNRFVDQPPILYHVNEPDWETLVREGLEDYRQSLPEERRVLFDRYQLEDFALKVVGIGSVGTRCYIALLFSEDNHPLILQVKEACPSVLEPYTAKSQYENQGQRVVTGQRLMQSSSDIFLGWTQGRRGNNFYLRQLRDMKFSLPIEGVSAVQLQRYAEFCGWTLARAHAKSGDAATISGYLGKGDQFDLAMGEFAIAYAEQTEQDHAALVEAVKTGRVEALVEENL